MVEQSRVSPELHYEIRYLTPGVQLRSPKTPLEIAGIPCVIENDTLIARPPGDRSSDLPTVSADLQAALDKWALELELIQGRSVVFRLTTTVWPQAPTTTSPSPSAGVSGQLSSVGINSRVSVTGDLSITLQAPLPAPTGDVALSPEVAEWIGRLRNVREGRELVTGAAYALFTHLVERHGGGHRSTAAATLRVSDNLLARLAQWASGFHATQGRKTARQQHQLTDSDLAWLERAMSRLIYRLAELHARQTNLPTLTLADVP